MNYGCPECGCRLNPGKGIVLVGERDSRRGLFVFDERPGHHGYDVEPLLEIDPGSVWEFGCPVCRTNLTTSFSERLAHLHLTDEDAGTALVFSKVAGEHATFVVGRETMDAYGNDTGSYLELSIQKHYW